jgi:hypothetical protein
MKHVGLMIVFAAVGGGAVVLFTIRIGVRNMIGRYLNW